MLKIIVALLLLCSASLADSRTHRSASVKSDFQRLHLCPATGQARGACPGYVKDHIIALACGGPDSVENMQWQTNGPFADDLSQLIIVDDRFDLLRAENEMGILASIVRTQPFSELIRTLH